MNLDAHKVDLALAGVVLLDDRLAELERRRTHRADEFNESKHPRGPDGKFVSGSGSAHIASAVNDYEAGLKGKKGSKGGLIQHMLKAKSYTKDEIFEAASEAFGLQPEHKSHINWYLQDLKKKGMDVGLASESQAPAAKAAEIDTSLPEGATYTMKNIKETFDEVTPEEFIHLHTGNEYATPQNNEYLDKLMAAAKAKLGQAPAKVEPKLEPEVAKAAAQEPEKEPELTQIQKQTAEMAHAMDPAEALEKITTSISNPAHPPEDKTFLQKLKEEIEAKVAGAKKGGDGTEHLAKVEELSKEAQDINPNGISANKLLDLEKALKSSDLAAELAKVEPLTMGSLSPLQEKVNAAIAAAKAAHPVAKAEEPAQSPEQTKHEEGDLHDLIKIVAGDGSTDSKLIALSTYEGHPDTSPAVKAKAAELKAKVKAEAAEAEKQKAVAAGPKPETPANPMGGLGTAYEKMMVHKLLTKAAGMKNFYVKSKANDIIAALAKPTLEQQAMALNKVSEHSHNQSATMKTLHTYLKGMKQSYAKHLPENGGGSLPAEAPKTGAFQLPVTPKAPEPGKSAVPSPPESGLSPGGYANADHAYKVASGDNSNETKIEQLKNLKGASPSSDPYIDQLISHLEGGKATTPAAHGHKLSAATKASYATNKAGWANALPANQPTLSEADAGLQAALAHPTAEAQLAAVKALSSIPNPTGMAQKSFNEHLAKVKADYGVTAPQTTSSLPAGPSAAIQQAAYQVAKGAPPKKIKSWSEYHDAKGNPVAANLHVDTSRVPGDHYAKVSSAYGDNHENAMTQAVDVAMTHYANDTYGKLASEEHTAIQSYQGHGYSSINSALLSGKGEGMKSVKAIDAAMKKSFIPADTPLYRGMRCSLKDLTGFDDPGKSVGRCFTHKNFASASRSIDTAKAFAGDHGGSSDRVILKFTMPAGTNGIVMPKQDWEREIVLDRNIMFKVDKVEQNPVGGGKAKHIIHCTYLGKRDDS